MFMISLPLPKRNSWSAVAYALRLGFRTALSTPLLREGRPVGTIHIRRLEVRPFSDKQIKLLETFADSGGDRDRKRPPLQRDVRRRSSGRPQPAIVLKVISRSTFDLQPVIETLIENAVGLCGACERGRVQVRVRRRSCSASRRLTTYRPGFKEFVGKKSAPPRPGDGRPGGPYWKAERSTSPMSRRILDYEYPASYAIGDIRSIL